MSSDNYYMIRRDRQGFFVPVMGFASAESSPPVRGNCPRFKEFHDAVDYAASEYSEYGIRVHDECYSDELPVLLRLVQTGHYPACDTHSAPAFYGIQCNCARIKADWDKDYSPFAE